MSRDSRYDTIDRLFARLGLPPVPDDPTVGTVARSGSLPAEQVQRAKAGSLCADCLRSKGSWLIPLLLADNLWPRCENCDTQCETVQTFTSA